MPARKNPNGPLARDINGGHPEGSKLYAAHCPPELAKRIDWVHARYQEKVPVQVRIAAIIRMLLEESVEKHIPKEVLDKFKAEEEKDDAKKKKAGG